MPTPPLEDEVLEQAVKALKDHGNQVAAAKALGIARNTLQNRLRRAAERQLADDFEPEIMEAAKAGGISDPANLSHFWKIVKDESGNGYSLFVKNPNGGERPFTEVIHEAIEEAAAASAPEYEPRQTEIPREAENLLVIDLADVHFGKLCVRTEAGFEYRRDIARHRVIEGTKALLRLAKPMGIARILFVLGNDILHVDDSRSNTTAGTNQDTEGSIFQMWKDAELAIVDAIKICHDVADVDLVHCMSNHDWKMGWALSQCVAAYFRQWPTVNASPYNLSEAHRKYYRFGSNLFGLTHGDGAKEEGLYGLMVKEARQHIGECRNLFWLLHHVHHKIRRRRGVDVFLAEKDHVGMTAIMSGAPYPEGSAINIEYVRSPSPPDGWHDRNGYVNRQGVEAFVFHPYEGQKARFTEWF
jgi:hypothetical protein